MLSFLLDPSDTDRAYVPFSSSDDVLLLINNMGGLSVLELGAFTHVVLERLSEFSTRSKLMKGSEYSISPIRIVVGSLMTSLNGSGASITLLNITKAASDADIAAEEILGYLDAPTEATAWPLARSYASYKGDMKQQLVEEEPMEDKPSWDEKEDINGTTLTLITILILSVESKLLESGLRMACKYMIESEPQLTIWDTQMGDGDCGTTVANGANGKLFREAVLIPQD
jgi:dihydroxyacetone kinase